MDTLIFHNGRILPLSEARLSPGQMGLLMGWGVFTTLRIYEGKPFAFDRHWARMTHDAERLGMSLGLEQASVCQSVSKLAEANNRPEGTARVSFVKNHGGLWVGGGRLPRDRSADLHATTGAVAGGPSAQAAAARPLLCYAAGGSQDALLGSKRRAAGKGSLGRL